MELWRDADVVIDLMNIENVWMTVTQRCPLERHQA
jgi:hypothetical protein